MTVISMILFLLFSAILQATLPELTFLGQARTPFLLSVVLYYALNREDEHMVLAAFLAGFLQDSLGSVPLGYSVLCFCIVGFVVGRFRGTLDAEAWITPVIFGGLAGLAVTFGLYLMLVREGLVSCPVWWVGLKGLGVAVLGMICTPIMFKVYGATEQALCGLTIGRSGYGGR